MAKKVVGQIKLQLPAGKATPAPPVGPALGQHGVNIMEFCKQFNAKTSDQAGLVIPAVITVYADRSFTFELKTPPASVLLKKAAGIESGSGIPNKTKVGQIPRSKVREIAEMKRQDLNANDVDAAMRMIEGGGGALLMEKVVATPTKDYIWVVDESKLVQKLGAFKLPVEVVQYGAEQVFRRFAKAGYKPSFREKNGQRFITDMQNFIIDLDLGVIENPIEFGRELDHIVGVVEHGLFNQMVNKVIVAGQDGVNVLEANK